MKKLIWPMMISVTLIVGCQNSEAKVTDEAEPKSNQPEQTVKNSEESDFPYPTLLSETDKTFSLLMVGEPDEEHPIEEDQSIAAKVENILSLPTVEMAKQAYPELNINQEPAFLLFDHTGVVHQSKDISELKSFLEKK